MQYIRLIYQGTAQERQAKELTDDGVERRFLDRRLAELSNAGITKPALGGASPERSRRCRPTIASHV